MTLPLAPIGCFGFGQRTQTADTVITLLIPPKKNAFTNITQLSYLSGGTAHTLTAMLPFNWTTFSADAAAAQAVVNITADPGAYSTANNWKYNQSGATPSVANNGIAANDYVAYELPDGNFVIDTVSSVSSLAITLTTNVPTGGVKEGGRFWFFGVAANTNPNTGVAHEALKPTVSTTTTYSDAQSTILRTKNLYDPIILHSTNATAQGYIQNCSGFYSKF